MVSEFLLLSALILLNAFFAASEIALISLNDHKIRKMAEDGDKKAIKLIGLLDEPSEFLAVIQIGITLAGFLASAFAAESFSGNIAELVKSAGVQLPDNWIKNISVILITVILSYITLVLGELVPKRMAMNKAEPISLAVAGALNLISKGAMPFVKLLTFSTDLIVKLLGVDPEEREENITEEEIRLMVDVGEEIGSIHETEKKLINNIFEFNDKVVQDIMVSRTDVAALSVGESFEKVVAAINTGKYSRMPVYEGSIDNIVGVFYSKDLVGFIAAGSGIEGFDLRKMIRPPYFVPASKKIDELMRELLGNKAHMAVVIDEYGGTSGIVTIEDLIEEIIGDVYDVEHVRNSRVVRLAGNTFSADGALSLAAAKEFLGVDIPEGDYGTLGGFMAAQLQRMPGLGDRVSIESSGVVMEVVEVEGRRLSKIRIEIAKG